MSVRPAALVAILNWNGEADTVRAVRSAQALEPPPEADGSPGSVNLLVIDNGSRPGSVDTIRRACPDVAILETGENLGYAGGNNVGLREAVAQDAEFCLVLNNDMEVDPPMLRRMIEAAREDPDLGILGPRVYRMDRPEELFYPGWRIDWRRWLFHRVAADPSPPELADVDYVQGCALLVRTELARAGGLFDEAYHLYCEDADLCVRARAMGWRTVEVASARAWHKGYGSARAGSPLKTYYGLRNRLYFIARHAPARNRWRLRAQLLAFDAAGQAGRAIGRCLRGDWRGGAAQLRALGAALLDWARGRMGRGPAWLFRPS